MIRSLAAALGVIDARKGLIPPNWGHTVLKSKSNGIPTGQPVNNAQADRNRRPSPDVYYQQLEGYDWDTVRYRHAGY